MLIEMLGDVTVDKTPIIRNFRLNIDPKNKKFRCKVEIKDKDKSIPLDLITRSYSFKLDGLNGFKIEIIGCEVPSSINFNLNITYEIFKKKFKLKGLIGNVSIDERFTKLVDLLSFIGNVFKNQLKIKS